jgi:glycosyltransferase involved in cell wall biosynthesis
VSRRLRVAMLLENNAYPGDVRVRNEAEALAGAGHAVTVIAPRGPGEPARERVGGVQVRRFRLPATPDTVAGIAAEYAIAHVHLYARGALELLRGADVVHMHNPPDTLFGVALLARALGRRAVFDHHDLGPELFAAKFGPGSRLAAALRAAQTASVRSASLAIATNETQRELLERLGRGRTPVVTVRNGPRAATLAEAAPGRGGALDDPRLAFLGTLGAQDGVDRLPGLMRSLARDHGMPRATLTVIGDGPRAGALAEAFATAGVSDRVRLLGWVPHAEVPGLLADADVCLDPADCTPLNHGSTMIKVSEYLAARRPLVAHELRETRRTAGDAALYVPCEGESEGEGESEAAFAAAVARLARDPELRERLAARAAERVPELVWERSEERLLAAYEDLGRRA